VQLLNVSIIPFIKPHEKSVTIIGATLKRPFLGIFFKNSSLISAKYEAIDLASLAVEKNSAIGKISFLSKSCTTIE
jgi:hypothetical protein